MQLGGIYYNCKREEQSVDGVSYLLVERHRWTVQHVYVNLIFLVKINNV